MYIAWASLSLNSSLCPLQFYFQQVCCGGFPRPVSIKALNRPEVLFHFTTLIFPSGYTVSVPGAVNEVPGSDTGRVVNKEGTVKADGTKGKDAGTIAGPTAQGALIGALAHGGKGALIGSGIGGVAGLAEVLFTRGNEINYPAGTPVEMVLQRPLVLEETRLAEAKTEYVPRQGPTRLEKPRLTPEPTPR